MHGKQHLGKFSVVPPLAVRILPEGDTAEGFNRNIFSSFTRPLRDKLK